MIKLSTLWQATVVVAAVIVASSAVAESVFISEFMAQNNTVLKDTDGDYSDWIEIHNAGATPVNLLGWRLTDKASDTAKWVFPATNLAPGAYMIVFASDKNRAVAGAELHTNFKLSASGEYLGLYRPDGVNAFAYAPAFPPQDTDISYGIPSGIVSNTLIATGAVCRAYVPIDDVLERMWTSNTFDDSGWLVGTSGVGFERSTGYEAMIGLDVGGPMYRSNASCYIRVPFILDTATQVNKLTLRMTYDDGYVPYINGRQGPGANNPEGLTWDAAATTYSAEPGTTVADLSNLRDALVNGTNVLAIHGLNQTKNSSDFLILPRLDGVLNLFSAATPPTQLAEPTPGAANVGAYIPTTADATWSHPRGFYDAPFALTLSCATAGATIRYTTNFEEPTLTYGTIYNGPIPINKTTCIRTFAYTNGYLPSACSTRTFIFPAQVATQAANQTAAGFTNMWVTSSGTAVSADYGMDQRITGPSDNYGGVYRTSITNDLRAIPTVSIVTTLSNLFNRYAGIYANPGGVGDNWERSCSFEYFNDPRDTNGTQVNCGLRIHGEANRSVNNRKHSLRLLFKTAYGDGKLKYPLFEGDPVERYNTIVLRCMYGDSWMSSSGGTYLRELWAHETQRALGHVGLYGRLVHVYLNGLYWGLYTAIERPDDAFAADHIAPPRENWDVLAGLITAAEVELKEGSRQAYNAMMALVPKSPTTTVSDVTYAQLEQYLDMPLFADYMLLQLYSQNYDWPNKNWRLIAQRNPANPAGPPLVKFRYFVWDQESTLGFYGQDRTTIGDNIAEMRGPAQIYKRIRGHHKFKRLFGDRAHKHMFNGGALTTVSNTERWVALMSNAHAAIVGESARWGDIVNPATPITRDPFPPNQTMSWYSTMDKVLNVNWFSFRNNYFLNSLRNAGLYPRIDAPTFSQFGGQVTNGYRLGMSVPSGTIYYTTNDDDPANLDDSVGATAVAYSGPVPLTGNVRIKARAKSGSAWSALTEAVFIIGRPPVRITELMYNPPAPAPESGYTADDFEFIELMNISSNTVPVRTYALTAGVQYSLSNSAMQLAPYQCLVIARNPAAFATRYDTATYAVVGGYAQVLDNGGEQIVMAEDLFGDVHDFVYDDAWYPETDGGGYSLTIADPYGDIALWNQAVGWRPSSQLLGTPGVVDIPEPCVLVFLLLALARRADR